MFDKIIIFIGSETCHNCEKLEDNIDDLDDIYNFPPIYFLDITMITTEEQIELFSNMDINLGVPVLRLYNNGLKDTIVGYQNKNTLLNVFEKNNMFNNSL